MKKIFLFVIFAEYPAGLDNPRGRWYNYIKAQGVREWLKRI